MRMLVMTTSRAPTRTLATGIEGAAPDSRRDRFPLTDHPSDVVKGDILYVCTVNGDRLRKKFLIAHGLQLVVPRRDIAD